MKKRYGGNNKENHWRLGEWYVALTPSNRLKFARYAHLTNGDVEEIKLYAQQARRHRLQQTAEKRRKDTEKGVKK
jgi:hypothetical protein